MAHAAFTWQTVSFLLREWVGQRKLVSVAWNKQGRNIWRHLKKFTKMELKDVCIFTQKVKTLSSLIVKKKPEKTKTHISHSHMNGRDPTTWTIPTGIWNWELSCELKVEARLPTLCAGILTHSNQCLNLLAKHLLYSHNFWTKKHAKKSEWPW